MLSLRDPGFMHRVRMYDELRTPANTQALRKLSSCVLSQTCPICDSYALLQNDRWYRLSCGHIYHRNCIMQWFRVRGQPVQHTCPECRNVNNYRLSGDCTNDPQPPVDPQPPPSHSGSAQGGGKKTTNNRPSAHRRASVKSSPIKRKPRPNSKSKARPQTTAKSQPKEKAKSCTKRNV